MTSGACSLKFCVDSLFTFVLIKLTIYIEVTHCIGVHFTNILWATFLYKSVMWSFSVLTVCVSKFLVKGNWQRAEKWNWLCDFFSEYSQTCVNLCERPPPNNDHLSTTTTLNPTLAIPVLSQPLNNDHLTTTTSGHLKLARSDGKTCPQQPLLINI